MRTWYSHTGAGQAVSLYRPSCSTVGNPACMPSGGLDISLHISHGDGKNECHTNGPSRL